jgi:IS4 transposase
LIEKYILNPPKFRTIKNLFHIIETDLKHFAGPEFTVEEIRLAEAPHDRHILAYRCVEKSRDYLFGSARFADKMAFAPVIKIGKDGIRQYNQVNTGNYWNLKQVSN